MGKYKLDTGTWYLPVLLQISHCRATTVNSDVLHEETKAYIRESRQCEIMGEKHNKLLCMVNSEAQDGSLMYGRPPVCMSTTPRCLAPGCRERLAR